MADLERSFPKIAESSWRGLRNLFKQKVPSVVSPTYLASALNMSAESAKGNLINPFIKIGILDESGKPSDLAYEWRDDSKYAKVCEVILNKIYPQELRDLYHSNSSDKAAIASWFMTYCRCGEPAARMYATFYKLLLAADLSEIEVTTRKKTTKLDTGLPRPSKDKKENTVLTPMNSTDDMPIKEPHQKHQTGSLPQLHINIQLHISPESTPDQIDKIFESMSKHLKDFKI